MMGSDQVPDVVAGAATPDRGPRTAGAPAPGEDAQSVEEAQEAHGGSMAPGLVDDTGHLLDGGAEEPPGPASVPSG